MQGFVFHSPSIPQECRIKQEVGGRIGFKIYPGALTLCRHLEQCPLPASSVVLELGSGVCALPSLVAAHGAGCHVITTDVPDILPCLADNIAANTASLSAGSCTVLPLMWGVPEHLPAVVAAVRELQAARSAAAAAAASGSGSGGGGGGSGSGGSGSETAAGPDAIIAADVVYHEPLIQPFLDTLVALTDPSLWSSGGSAAAAAAAVAPAAPPILLSYVQRFKRAKAFFKLARKYFDITAVPLGTPIDLKATAAPTSSSSGSAAATATATATAAAAAAAGAEEAAAAHNVVDYDCLSWTLPVIAASNADGSEQAALVHIDSGSAMYDGYLGSLTAAAARKREQAQAKTVASERGPTDAAAASGAGAAPEAAPAVKRSHAIDSDSEDEWENNEGYATALLSSLGALAQEEHTESAGAGAGTGTGTEGGSGADGSGAPGATAAAAAAATVLGVPFAEPLKGYLYVLRRRLNAGSGSSGSSGR